MRNFENIKKKIMLNGYKVMHMTDTDIAKAAAKQKREE
jgi:hypothetical protein